MTRKEALRQIQAEDLAERLAAARFFQKSARHSDLTLLQTAQEHELSPWVQHALGAAIAGIGGANSTADVDDSDRVESDDAGREQSVESKAVEQITRILTHELSSIIGRLEVKAHDEISNYDASRTALEVDRLKRLSASLATLATAARVASADEFELGSELRAVVERFNGGLGPVALSFAGPEPITIVSDRFLVDLIVKNAIKNSAEAFDARGRGEDDSIVVTWGSDAANWWIAVNDNGPGLGDVPSRLLTPGVSSKDGHTGFGLFIARQAARSLGGDIVLDNASSGGAVFRVIWSRRPFQ